MHLRWCMDYDFKLLSEHLFSTSYQNVAIIVGCETTYIVAYPISCNVQGKYFFCTHLELFHYLYGLKSGLPPWQIAIGI